MQHPNSPADYPVNTLIEGISEEIYNAHPGLRSTELKAATVSSAHWKAYTDAAGKDTPAMALGRLCHLAVLEPEKFENLTVVMPKFGLKKEDKERKVEWLASLPVGAIIATEADYGTARCVSDAVFSHPVVAGVMLNSVREAALFWQDADFDMPQKARYDLISSDGLVFDLKTTRIASPQKFARDAVDLHYGLSAAHYLEGARVAEVANPHNFCIIACEKTPPYGVIVYDLSPQAIERGANWRKHALANIRRAKETNVFDAYPQHVIALEEPAWAPQCAEYAGNNG